MAFIKSWRLPLKESATGVGLQILHNGVPFELGSAANVLNETLIGINEIPLSAQYYQTERKSRREKSMASLISPSHIADFSIVMTCQDETGQNSGNV